MSPSYASEVLYGRNQRLSLSTVAVAVLLGVVVWLVYPFVQSSAVRPLGWYLLPALVAVPVATTLCGEGVAVAVLSVAPVVYAIVWRQGVCYSGGTAASSGMGSTGPACAPLDPAAFFATVVSAAALGLVGFLLGRSFRWTVSRFRSTRS